MEKGEKEEGSGNRRRSVWKSEEYLRVEEGMSIEGRRELEGLKEEEEDLEKEREEGSGDVEERM